MSALPEADQRLLGNYLDNGAMQPAVHCSTWCNRGEEWRHWPSQPRRRSTRHARTHAHTPTHTYMPALNSAGTPHPIHSSAALAETETGNIEQKMRTCDGRIFKLLKQYVLGASTWAIRTDKCRGRLKVFF